LSGTPFRATTARIFGNTKLVSQLIVGLYPALWYFVEPPLSLSYPTAGSMIADSLSQPRAALQMRRLTAWYQ
jgi:hypothetical protein